MVCVETGEWFDKRCGSARASRCEYCAELKRGDIAHVGRSGWTDRPTDRGYWVTLTAPGSDVLPWDKCKCNHHPNVKCSGDIGCVVEAEAAARWHYDLGQRWSWFVTEMRRQMPGADVQFFKTYEPQKRQALHIHAMVRVTGASDREVQAAFDLARERYGFGEQTRCEQIDLSDPRNAALKAGYCAKYSGKSADTLPDVLRLSPHGEIRTGGLRSWSASRSWGVTMRQINSWRSAWAASQGGSGATESTAAPGGGEADPLDLNRDLYATSVDGLLIFRPSEAPAAV